MELISLLILLRYDTFFFSRSDFPCFVSWPGDGHLSQVIFVDDDESKVVNEVLERRADVG